MHAFLFLTLLNRSCCVPASPAPPGLLPKLVEESLRTDPPYSPLRCAAACDGHGLYGKFARQVDWSGGLACVAAQHTRWHVHTLHKPRSRNAQAQTCLLLPPCRPPCSIFDIEQTGVPPPPKMDAYLKSRVAKFYAQLAVRGCVLLACRLHALRVSQLAMAAVLRRRVQAAMCWHAKPLPRCCPLVDGPPTPAGLPPRHAVQRH